ncbi:Cation-transporting ATPase, E1-E2 family [Clostridiaceae bacterium JG1575]|nr:Cation-transporting ATPase, E1-E2 family [Clostridiaceae bacterium JG1575]
MKEKINQAQPKEPKTLLEREPLKADVPQGLTEEAARAKIERKEGNVVPKTNTRSVARIVWDNSMTLFNLLNVVLGALVLYVAVQEPHYLRNGFFMGIVLINTGIHIIQELRAKFVVDRLVLLTEPRAVVRRSGKEQEIPKEEVVVGDLLRLCSGGQVSVDGVVVSSDSLELDESQLTGESNPMAKKQGERVLSGSLVVAGSGWIEVDKVGEETFAGAIAREAKREKRNQPRLVVSLNRILKYVSFMILPLGTVILIKSFFFQDLATRNRIIVSNVALLISMMPEGLILLTSVALALGVMRMAKKRALVQRTPAIETLARVDVLCLDKTGTLTTGRMKLLGLVPLVIGGSGDPAQNSGAQGPKKTPFVPLNEEGQAPAFQEYDKISRVPKRTQQALEAFSAAFPEGNATQEAINNVFQGSDPASTRDKRPFSSARKWSALTLADGVTWYLGAHEMLLSEGPLRAEIQEKVLRIAKAGYRVLLLGKSEKPISKEASGVPDEALQPEALLVIADELRADVAGTLRYFKDQNVQVKMISGDNPETLAAIASRAGLKNLGAALDMSALAATDDLSSLAESTTLFARVSPEQKRELLRALKKAGHTVAMTGDGVNDVLALKEADCAVAMASGSEAARAAADMVLLEDNMAQMVDAVDEGRRVINNIERVAALFLIKTTYASLFALLALPLALTYPILPIQGTIINSATVGIPSFLLTLKPNKDRVVGNFLANVVPRALPAGISAAVFLLLLQLFATELPHQQKSTYATFLLIIITLRALFTIMRPLDPYKAVLFILCLLIPVIALIRYAKFFLLTVPPLRESGPFLAYIGAGILFHEGLVRLGRTPLAHGIRRRLFGPSREDIATADF